MTSPSARKKMTSAAVAPNLTLKVRKGRGGREGVV
jgi:hypothetical protein